MTDGHPRAPARVSPGVLPGLLALAAYAVAVVGIQASSGVPYQEWFDSTGQVLRAPLPAFATGAVLLVGVTVWWRWDGVWVDRPRRRMGVLLWLPVALTGAALVLQLLAADWAALPTDLLLAVAATTLLVGLCEELLFRGILLRAARERYREVTAVVATATVFGLFHVVNLALGAPVVDTTTQVVSAALAGVASYLLRRGTGILLAPILLHALYDLSVVLPVAQTTLGTVAALLRLPTWLAVVVAVVVLAVREDDPPPAGGPGRRQDHR